MKLISLNTWGGKVREPLTKFISKHSTDIDIFCFQEIYFDAEKRSGKKYTDANPYLYELITKLLPNHSGYFCPTVGDYFGNAIFIKKTIPVIKTGEVLLYENPHFISGGDRSRKMQWIEIHDLLIMNVHGLWTGKGKGDTDTRIEQSLRIRKHMDSYKGRKVLCGDFNLRPDTESLAMVSRGMNDLIKDFSVTSTRTPLYTHDEKYADYVFTSPDIEVIDFKVLPDVVSDHSALLLEYK